VQNAGGRPTSPTRRFEKSTEPRRNHAYAGRASESRSEADQGEDRRRGCTRRNFRCGRCEQGRVAHLPLETRQRIGACCQRSSSPATVARRVRRRVPS